jgi:hypothetical protein
MADDYTVLNKKNDEIYNNLNNNLKCIDDSDDESLTIDNNTELLGDNSEDDSDNDNYSSDSDEETLPSFNESETITKSSESIDAQPEKCDDISDEDTSKVEKLESVVIPKKGERKVPNDIASKFGDGHRTVSENDGKLYKVFEYKSGKKRWILAK